MIEKLEFLEKKKQEYISQVMSINGAIQCLQELLAEPENKIVIDEVK